MPPSRMDGRKSNIQVRLEEQKRRSMGRNIRGFARVDVAGCTPGHTLTDRLAGREKVELRKIVS
jgi:hypothetical protein